MYGNTGLVIKTIVMFALYITPFVLLLSGAITGTWLMLLMWILMGLGAAGIGFNVMHDANHGVFSKNRRINKWLGYSMDLIGSSAYIWRFQHNVLHHTYTNINEADDDIGSIPALLRLSPEQKKRPVHRFQHLYAWFLYGLMTLFRTILSDFIKIFKYRNMGLIKSGKEFTTELIYMIICKTAYFGYMLVLPLLLIPAPAGVIILDFITMHFVIGLVLALIFQTAHVMPSAEFPAPDKDGHMENAWAVHELITTTNYAPTSRIFSWMIGGLNYQIEHHLFTNVSHVHYKDISSIVRQTAEEYGLPYHTHGSFLSAVWDHAKMLKYLGHTELKKPGNVYSY